MEVATIITSSEHICTLFDKFIYSYPLLYLYQKDDDTAYFKNDIDDKFKLFYHYKFNEPKTEFSYNYSEVEISEIKNFCGNRPIYMFDLSYRSENILAEMLKEFRLYVKTHDEKLLSYVLISHPFDGLKRLDKEY